MPKVEKGSGDVKTPNSGVILPEKDEVAEGPSGAQDQHVPGLVVEYTDSVQQPTVKDYRDKGYQMDDKLDDDAIPHVIQGDQFGEVGTVSLPDGRVYQTRTPLTLASDDQADGLPATLPAVLTPPSTPTSIAAVDQEAVKAVAPASAAPAKVPVTPVTDAKPAS